MSKPLVEIRNLSKGYFEASGARPVLRDVSLDIATGEFIVLLGRSGSGKSTLLNLIGGVIQPDQGSIAVDGEVITDLSETGRSLFRRRAVGMIFQNYNLIPTLTVGENVELRLELKGVRDRQSRVEHWLESVGLDDRLSSYPDVLSGGEQQRVAIAAALVHEPELVLADEPTGSLDEETGEHVVTLLDRLVREQRKTLVMATHSRSMIGYASRIFRIKNAELVEDQPGVSA